MTPYVRIFQRHRARVQTHASCRDTAARAWRARDGATSSSRARVIVMAIVIVMAAMAAMG